MPVTLYHKTAMSKKVKEGDSKATKAKTIDGQVISHEIAISPEAVAISPEVVAISPDVIAISPETVSSVVEAVEDGRVVVGIDNGHQSPNRDQVRFFAICASIWNTAETIVITRET